MRALFCHDGPLRKDEYNNFYGTAHNNDTFSRYYTIADEISAVMRVSKISNAEAQEQLSKITISNFDVCEIPNLSSLRGALVKRNQAKEIIKAAVEAADYIVVRLPSVIGFHAYDYAKKFDKPCLVEVVACPWDAFWNHSLIGKCVAPFMYFGTKKRVINASHVVYVTNNFLQRRYPTKGKQVSCSNVSLKKFDDGVLEKRINKIESMQSEKRIIIGTTAAVNVKYKGQQYIIEALAQLKSQGLTNYEYQLVGGGDQQYLRTLAKRLDVVDKVVFLGALPHSKIFDWLDNIDIYVQPSRQEGLPRALIEAMSRGLPAFGANTAGIPELIEHQFIFSNSNRNTNEICLILGLLTKELMLEQAKRNYKESKKYDRRIIEGRRTCFFENFIK